jgi:hypothetical protein
LEDDERFAREILSTVMAVLPATDVKAVLGDLPRMK